MEKIPTQQVDTKPQKMVVNLYAKSERIYVRAYKGIYRSLRNYMAWVLLLIYYVTPWLTWDDRQAILFDLPARQFHILSLTFWPQDFALLSGLLILFTFILFFVTVFAGRAWCGYACFQTVWTYFFMWAEEFAEGSRNARTKLDKQSMSVTKFRKKFVKHTLWSAISIATAITFVGYFTPITDLLNKFSTFEFGPWESWWLLFFTVATYLNSGYMREQVCKYMCPYARFQSVMFDPNTLIITYDEARGEPRGKGSRKQSTSDDLGDCVDCNVCVAVCPVGIDIRDGLQYECISCAACIDGCNEVMERLGKPKGLVRYATENVLEGQSYHLLRSRFIGYGLAVLVISAFIGAQLLTRVPIEVDLIRDRQTLFHDLGEGVIENTYHLKVSNKSQETITISVALNDVVDYKYIGQQRLLIAPNATIEQMLRIQIHTDNLISPKTDITFDVKSINDKSIRMEQESRFLAPAEQVL
ncbi:MAG: cytochrome c oxidase accessory protein CcoG [Gammaproteobacteria bacterium]|nr:cytochrome c oxidase accessory protein CcoG [Gammaproteobacteria bacterium]